MTTQQLLPLTPAGAVLIGDATALVTDDAGGCSSAGSSATRGTPATTWGGGWQRSSWCASRRLAPWRWLPRSGSPPSPCGAGAGSLTPPVPRPLPRTSAAPRDPHG